MKCWNLPNMPLTAIIYFQIRNETNFLRQNQKTDFKSSEKAEREYLRTISQHYENELKLEEEVIRLKQLLVDRDSEIDNLKREIHKLKVSCTTD